MMYSVFTHCPISRWLLVALAVSWLCVGTAQTFTAEQDHRNMMDQLGIKALRPGPSGDEKAPNHANYDESLANPFSNVPDALTLNDGQKVTSPQLWAKRRAEI